MTNIDHQTRVLALDIRPRSSGFAVFEGSRNLLYWGVKDLRSGVNAAKLPAASKLLALIDEFAPSVIAIKKSTNERSTIRRNIIATIQRQAKERKIPVILISSEEIRRTFTGSKSNKFGVASALAQRFDVLVWRLPPKRKCWQTEDYRMSIFDAVAVGIAYFGRFSSSGRQRNSLRFQRRT